MIITLTLLYIQFYVISCVNVRPTQMLPMEAINTETELKNKYKCMEQINSV